MILIFSVSKDKSTQELAEWLRAFSVSFFIFDEYVRVKSISLTSNSYIIQTDSIVINYNDVKTVFYRRGGYNIVHSLVANLEVEENKLDLEIKSYVEKELLEINDYVHKLNDKKYVLSKFHKSIVNKLTVLEEAQKVGLKIPLYLVSNNIERLIKFIKKNDCITKSVKNNFVYFSSEFIAQSYTEVVLISDLTNGYDIEGFPNFIQKKVEKSFEVRTVFLNKKTYSMAIFSQSNDRTKIDFRKYDDQSPNRTIPFVLPTKIDNMLIALHEKLDLEFSSVDFVVDQFGQYYFLEINPVGQFGMVSKPCNYNLERQVAQIISDHGA